ncbi:hypothetical protein RF638_03690 [Kocuria sp. CPCC 205235]|uniref:hypothetical protein n=1 Tax=Kocuria sp. CPCC 205235 TaxID=3073549 RepID=UPI0034D4CCEA
MAFTVSLLVGLLISVPLAALPNELLTVWLGSEFAFAAPALAVVVVGVMAEAMGQVPNLIMTLRGNPLIASLISLAVLLLTLPAVWIASDTGDLGYVMLAAVAPLLLLVPVQIYFSERTETSGSRAKHVLEWLGMVVAAAVGAVLSIGVCALILGIVFLGAFKRIRRRDDVLNERDADQAPA